MPSIHYLYMFFDYIFSVILVLAIISLHLFPVKNSLPKFCTKMRRAIFRAKMRRAIFRAKMRKLVFITNHRGGNSSFLEHKILYKNIRDILKSYEQYKDIKMIKYGRSVQNRPLCLLKISNSKKTKFAVLITGATHGNEYSNIMHEIPLAFTSSIYLILRLTFLTV